MGGGLATKEQITTKIWSETINVGGIQTIANTSTRNGTATKATISITATTTKGGGRGGTETTERVSKLLFSKIIR